MRFLCRNFCLMALAVAGVEQGRPVVKGAGPEPTPIFLDQGWKPADRENFYSTAQGSQLIPYPWFLALEQLNNETLFRNNDNLDRLRFVTRDPSALNPDGLPVGFVKDSDIDTTQQHAMLAYREQRDDKDKAAVSAEKTWLGMTCAACHTNRIEYNGTVYQIDGAPSMADVQTFVRELAEALDATSRDEAKLQRFASRLAGSQNRVALRDEVAAHADVLTALVKRNASHHPYGFARLDAFGAIMNAVCDAGLGIPANRVEANAPVSYPFLWDTPRMDWVQWNASANIALARNVGEVLGVFGYFSLLPGGPKPQFESTVRLKSLIALERQIETLKAPPWPEAFGKLDKVKVDQGRTLFAKNCASCHQVRNSQGTFAMVDMAGESRIETHATLASVIKTDPQMIRNLAQTVEPGLLKAMLPPELANLERVPRAELLKIVVREVTKHRAIAEMVPLTPNPASKIAPPHNGAGYASRALEGIWATAPFLHNGSVPNLYELLLPSGKRSRSFFLGSRRFDPKKVGFVTEATPGTFEFKVADANGPIVGNSNQGHEGPRCTQTREKGEWREFNDDERYALVEYMKALGTPLAAATPPQPDPNPERVAVEKVPEREAEQIKSIIAATVQQLKNRYPDQKPVFRGVHAKDHGCVEAVFDVVDDLDEKYRVGIFSTPGQQYKAWIRFSNAATQILPDNTERGGKSIAGSRGMAIKLLGVKGTPLLEPYGALTQDFLLINQPVFAFANVEDYEVLSNVLADPANKEDGSKFFAIQFAKEGDAKKRALRTGEIIKRIQALTVVEGAFQPQPASPVDCAYFSAAPFLFGDGAVMKYAAVPVDPTPDPKPNLADPNYLRNALIERLAVREGAKPVVFKFQVQRRDAKGLDLPNEIENASTEWLKKDFEFVTVATITIPPQEFDTPERRAACENFVFTPWHGLTEFRPLGGLNRMRRAVYEASSQFRHQPKEPAAR